MISVNIKDMILIWLYKHEMAETKGQELLPYSLSEQLGINDNELEAEIYNLKFEGLVDSGSVIKSSNGLEGVVRHIKLTDIGCEKAEILFNILKEKHVGIE